jgi:hypothetical protein
MTTQHTPTPYEVANINDKICIYANQATKSGKIVSHIVAELDYENGIPHEEAEANAAFIVKAVNAHDEMLQLLKEALYFVEHGDAKMDTTRKIQAFLAKVAS